MRWFKHMTGTREDERIANLIAIGGMEAYGFYWAMIEIIAKQIEKGSDKCGVTYPLPYLSHQLYLHHNKVSNLLGKCEVTGLLLVSKSEVGGGVNFTVSCPNLLKYRDEYATRKAKNRDKLPSNSRVTPEQETDTEADTEAEAEADTNCATSSTKISKNVADLLQPLKKISPSPLEIKNLVAAVKAGCTQQTVINLLKRKPAIAGFNHAWQLDELIAQKRIDESASTEQDDIFAELERRYPNGGGRRNAN